MGVDGSARVVDFGVAKAAGRLQTTREGQIKGKLAYMPPEQIRGEALDRRVDVYAASVVAWEALAGKRLFTDEEDGADPQGARRHQDSAEQSQPRRTGVARERRPERARSAALRAMPDAGKFAEALETTASRSGIVVASTRSVSEILRQLRVASEERPKPTADSG